MTAYKLHAYWRSSASWRVRIALNWKKLPYEIAPVQIVEKQQFEHDYREKNAMAQVPTLEINTPDGVKYLGQSMAILEYLEDAHPALPLLPRDPYLRGRSRQLAEIVNSGIQPFQNLKTHEKVKALGGNDRSWTQDFIKSGFDAMEEISLRTAGDFLVGNEPSFADLCLVPQLYTARRFEVALDSYPTLLRAERNANRFDAFVRAHAEKQPDAPKT